MAVLESAEAELPPSHVFFTISRGRAHRTFAIRRVVLVLCLIATAIAGVWSIGCTAYVMCHDRLVASLMRRERDLQYSYEDRVAALQKQVDRSQSDGLVSQRSINAKLNELTAREAELRSKTGTVARMTEQVLRLSPRSAGMTGDSARTSAFATSSEPVAKPIDVIPAPTPSVVKPHVDAALEPTAADLTAPPDRLAVLSADFGALSLAQDRDLSALGRVAQATLSHYRQAVNEAGLTLDRFAGKDGKASGGPFVPLAAGGSDFDRESMSVGTALAEVERLRGVAAHIPFDKPLEGTPEVTSPFGPRIDPFLGRPGMHTGIDLREDTGTEVFATAPGRVTVAGPASGYGTMVEIDHGDGLTTRYGHLSATEVRVGETVKAGEVIGRVGATGRATGPHLHYETRIDGEAVDPMRFLIAGHHLSIAAGPL